MYHFANHLLARGDMYEESIKVMKELKSAMHEKRLFRYHSKSKIHEQLANSYRNILQKPRFSPQYKRVTFLGNGHPGKNKRRSACTIFGLLHLRCSFSLPSKQIIHLLRQTIWWRRCLQHHQEVISRLWISPDTSKTWRTQDFQELSAGDRG